MPATLPWPKMPQTPAKIGTFLPSTTVICAFRKCATACAIVSRIVFAMVFLPNSLHCRNP